MTAFADQAVLLPLAASVVLGFALSGWRRGAIGWGAAVAATLTAMLVLKLSFIACGHLLPFASLRSPSGHTASAAVVYGSLLAMWIRLKTGTVIWTVPSALVFMGIIGTTRLLLGVHSTIEVVMGGTVGLIGAVIAVMLAGPPPPQFRFRWIGIAMIAVVVIFHGFRLPAEIEIRQLAFTMWPFTACR